MKEDNCPQCGEEMGEAFGSRRLYCDKCHPEEYMPFNLDGTVKLPPSSLDRSGSQPGKEAPWNRLKYYREIHKLDMAALERYRIRLLAGMDKIEREYNSNQEQTEEQMKAAWFDWRKTFNEEPDTATAWLACFHWLSSYKLKSQNKQF